MAHEMLFNPELLSNYDYLYSTEVNPSVSRIRRTVPETGSFGKSTRRSRSRTGTPAAKREDPTLAAADAIFSQFLTQRTSENPESPQRKTSLSTSISQPNISSSALVQIDGNTGNSSRFSTKQVHKEPTEVILRGFDSTQQYAVIREYERLAGRICEDYPRDAPIEQRRFKTDLRDQASLRKKPLTAEEKAKALKFAGGEHWIKVTFESADAAEIAVESSPQTIMGHLVYAELYRGVPPTADEPVPIGGAARGPGGSKFQAQSVGVMSGLNMGSARRPSSTLPRSFTPAMRELRRGDSSISPPGSSSSSQTIDTGTIASTTSSATVTGIRTKQQQQAEESPEDQLYCRKIPTARRIQLLPADQALQASLSWQRRMLNQVPWISSLTSDVFGSSVPRDEQGEFDRKNATWYWIIMAFIDSLLGGLLGIVKDNSDWN
ncbi:uncharacterized protein RCO7_09320 [Rhynchosporium graminicola]|uniref:Nucleoporin NUP53 n=1 Tax=Rhynchosporium graminicola TaxID=2792576 RepID=A0A1E1LCL6_9HELO|nr:uncharacterized protein RCO7_09320 [Rhynchosporium commune]